MNQLYLPSLEEVDAARKRIAPHVLHTPLVKLNCEDLDREIFLKLENSQPTGSFKIRPAYNSILCLSDKQKSKGVCTISSGNMALGLAHAARNLSIPMAAYLYDGAPPIKIQGIRELGGQVRYLSEARWYRCIHLEEALETPETMVHPVLGDEILSGNGTIGLEIMEDMPDLDAVVTPFGGGACTIGIGAILKRLKPDTQVIAAEGEHGHPLSLSMQAGVPVKTTLLPSFVKSIGSTTVFDEIFDFAKEIVDAVCVVSLESIAEAIRTLAFANNVVAEGAGAATLSAALSEDSLAGKKVVCLISGGNIDNDDYARILRREQL
jgi:threonine dehydratase